jgi:hypothetical protein
MEEVRRVIRREGGGRMVRNVGKWQGMIKGLGEDIKAG